ncbi:hypothetical protein MKK70_21370 [Methylobacterium sp. E-041]|uniref:hypothetical protein n=1 Tax=Methylobacterium sp. E-041 TaxID=2836573 RepID=UPI001FBAEF27|nr:hypothetical protein [Methylobacterium sp. E-041]MCJ2107879.1 hypothetical protein [Methylobacterium sp. E-041]
MADSQTVPTSVVSLLKDIVGGVVMQQAQIAELQADRATLLKENDALTARIADLEAHATAVTGDAGLTT